MDIRYPVPIAGQWLYSVLIFDGYSRAIVGAGCCERQNLARVLQVFRQALMQWSAPEAVVSDHGAVFVALTPCLRQLNIQWSLTTKEHPWQNRAESGCAIQRHMLDAYVVGCTEREQVYRQHAQFVRDDQFWGHWAHQRYDAHGRIYDLSPEVMLGQAQGRALEPMRLRRALRLRQLTRTVRLHGPIRLHNFGLSVDPGLWGHPVEVWVYDNLVRIEHAEHVEVAYSCVYDPRQRRITKVDGTWPSTMGPGTYDPIGVVGVGPGADRLAHAAVSPGDPAATGMAHTTNQLVAAFYKLKHVQIRIEGSRTLQPRCWHGGR